MNVKRGMIECGTCHATWGGASTCHAACCHRTFTGLTAFDAHRKGGRCNEPVDVGLELVSTRTYPCYGWISDGTNPWIDSGSDDAS